VDLSLSLSLSLSHWLNHHDVRHIHCTERNGRLSSIYSGHVVVIGDITYNGLKALVREITYTDNKLATRIVVILHPNQPTPEIKQLMRKYPENLLYFCGSPMVKHDLRRIRLRHAAACFILSHAASDDVGRTRHTRAPFHCIALHCIALHCIALLVPPLLTLHISTAAGPSRGRLPEHPTRLGHSTPSSLDPPLRRGSNAKCTRPFRHDLELHEHLHLGAYDGTLSQTSVPPLLSSRVIIIDCSLSRTDMHHQNRASLLAVLRCRELRP